MVSPVIPVRDERREKAFKKRYNRDVKIHIIHGVTDEGQKYYTLHFSSKNKYTLTEFFTNDLLTDYVTLTYQRENRTITNKFDRCLEGEIAVVDKISEEEDGDNN